MHVIVRLFTLPHCAVREPFPKGNWSRYIHRWFLQSCLTPVTVTKKNESERSPTTAWNNTHTINIMSFDYWHHYCHKFVIKSESCFPWSASIPAWKPSTLLLFAPPPLWCEVQELFTQQTIRYDAGLRHLFCELCESHRGVIFTTCLHKQRNRCTMVSFKKKKWVHSS